MIVRQARAIGMPPTPTDGVPRLTFNCVREPDMKSPCNAHDAYTPPLAAAKMGAITRHAYCIRLAT
jgi:hypothetical protein